MQIGIFAKTFECDTPDAAFSAVRQAGYQHCQYNMTCSGIDAMPDGISEKIEDEFKIVRNTQAVTVDALSATFNMAHPDQARRYQGTIQLETLAKFAASMKIPMLSLCTGSRDPTNQWAHHLDNQSAEAQRDLVSTLERAINIAEQHNVLLGIEPEHGNVINTAQAAHELLTNMSSNRLRIIIDPANLIVDETGSEQHSIIAEAIDLLGDHLVMAHAKDRNLEGQAVAPGKGIVDFSYFLAHLKAIGFQGPLTAHGFGAAEAPDVLNFLESHLA